MLTKKMESKIISVRKETPQVVTFRMLAPFAPSTVPGQFVMLGSKIDGVEREIRRSYSIAGTGSLSSGEKWIEVTVKKQPLGLFSKHLFDLAEAFNELNKPPQKEPIEINLYGPFGKYFVFEQSKADLQTPIVFVAGGTGIAPFRYFVQEAISSGWRGKFYLLFSAKTSEEIIYQEEMHAWREAGITVIVTLTRPAEKEIIEWKGLFGRVNEKLIRETVEDDFDKALYFVCGPTLMVVDVQNVLSRAGIAASKVKTEKYGAIEG